MASAHFGSHACLTLDTHKKDIYAAINIAISSLGLLGGLYQIVTWRIFLRRNASFTSRTDVTGPTSFDVKRVTTYYNPSVILFLALADILACIGVQAKSIELLIFQPSKKIIGKDGEWHREPHHYHYVYVDGIVTSIGDFAYLASFFWTFCFALDILFQLRQRRIPLSVYHVICWGSAAIITILKVVLKYGGNAEVCELPYDQSVANYLSFYLPIVFVMLACPTLFALSLPKIWRLQIEHHRVLTNQQRRVYRSVAWKFFMFVISFWLCWISNGVNGVYMMSNASTYESPFVFYVVEAMTNPLQGFLNAFIYGRHQEVSRLIKFRHVYDEASKPIVNWRTETNSEVM